METTMKGSYSLEITRGATGETEVHDFENLITDAGMNRFGAMIDRDTDWINYVHIGGGSQTPTNADVALKAFVASQRTGYAASYGVWDDTEKAYKFSYIAAFPQGAVVGNMTEVGAGPGPDIATAICSRALIKDSQGNPTVLTLTAIDQLTVTYSLWLYPKLTDTVSTLVIDGVSRTITIRPWNITANVNSPFGSPVADPQGNGTAAAFSDGIVGIYSGPSQRLGGASLGNGNVNYLNNSFKIQFTKSFPVDQGNGLIAAICLDTYSGHYQMGIDPPVAKDNTKTFTLVFETSWARKT